MSNFKLIKVPGDGNCFFYALYQALKNKNLLHSFVTEYLSNYNISNEKNFADKLRIYLSTNNEFSNHYKSLIDAYCSLREQTINELILLNNIPPENKINFIQTNEHTIQGAVSTILGGFPFQVQSIITGKIGGHNSSDYQTNCNNDNLKQDVLKDILNTLKEKEFWAAELEVKFIEKLLKKININLAVVYSTENENIDTLVSEPKTIVLINDTEIHYSWLKPTNIDSKSPESVKKFLYDIKDDKHTSLPVHKKNPLLTPLNRTYPENTINNDDVKLYDFEPYWDETKEPSTINHTLFSILNPYNAPYVNFDKQIDELFDSSPEGTTNEINEIKGGSKDLEKIKEKIENFIIKSINTHDYGCDTNNELFLKEIVKNMEPTKLKNIYEVNFIKDMKMVTKFVTYRLLEIRKQIRLINYAIETYKKMLVYIKLSINVDSMKKMRLILMYIKNKETVKTILRENIIKNKQAFIKNLLCRYVSLKYILNKIQTNSLDKIQTNSLDKMSDIIDYKNAKKKEDETENEKYLDIWSSFFVGAFISSINTNKLIFVNNNSK